MELRDYQQEAVNSTYTFIQETAGKNACVVIPTGGGKTPVIATFCKDAVLNWNSRVLVLAHVKELLQQTARTLQALCPTVSVGVYSAGLKRRDTDHAVIVAGVQSVYDKAQQLGRFDLVIVDEAHLIPPSGDGMYRSLIDDLIELNPDLRVIGLTATPYRLGSGLICGDDRLLHEICYEVGVKQLINQGYLSPLTGKAAVSEIATEHLKIERGEFTDESAGAAFADVVSAAAAEVVERTAFRKSVLVFCQTVEHAQRVAQLIRYQVVEFKEDVVDCLTPAVSEFGLIGDQKDLSDHRLPIIADWLEDRQLPVLALRAWLVTGNMVVGEVYGDTDSHTRAAMIERFRTGSMKYLVNVNVLTTGFDAPNVDAVCLLRATVSPGLYYQMVGRGFRLCEGKANCLVLDFGQNIKRHGPVDAIKAKLKGGNSKQREAGGDDEGGKVCPECRTVAAVNQAVCLDCGHQFVAERVGPKHERTADDEEPVSDNRPKTEQKEVLNVTYRVHTKKNADAGAPKTMRVTYQTAMNEWVSEWVCVEHTGFAKDKARKWWSRRCDFPMPQTAVEAVQYAEHGLLAPAVRITVKTKPGSEFPEIVGHEVGEIPTHPTPCDGCGAVNMRAIVPNEYDMRHPGKIVCGTCNHLHGYADPTTTSHYGFYDGLSDIGLLELDFEQPPMPDFNLIDQIDESDAGENHQTVNGQSYFDDCPF